MNGKILQELLKADKEKILAKIWVQKFRAKHEKESLDNSKDWENK